MNIEQPLGGRRTSIRPSFFYVSRGEHTMEKILRALATVVLIGAGAALAESAAAPLPVSDAPYANDPRLLRFLIFSDRTGGARAGIFEDAVDKINLLMPEFVINVGDCIEGYTDDVAELNRQWQEFDNIVEKLPSKYYRVAGNHDLGNPAMRKLWQQKYGRSYYHFVYKGALFLVLDTEDPTPPPPPARFMAKHLELAKLKAAARTSAELRDYYLEHRDFVEEVDVYMKAMISREQLDYFEKVLRENSDVRWTFLFMHKPAWREPYVNARFLALEKLLADRRYSVFAGHTHEYQQDLRHGQQYVTLATTGGEILDPFSEQVFDHVMWVTLDDREPRFVNLEVDGISDVRGRQPPHPEAVDQLKSRLGIAPRTPHQAARQ
jgi:hypothetical protein